MKPQVFDSLFLASEVAKYADSSKSSIPVMQVNKEGQLIAY
jgi:hypothetical protein